MLLIVLTAFGTIIVSKLSSANIATQKRQKTTTALALAKEALIVWSATRGGLIGTERPGELPCPDTYDPVTEINMHGYASGSCVSGKVGRLPWKTLGIPELLDADGEPLWYAVDGSFRVTSDSPINSDTRATLQVYQDDGVTLSTLDGEEAAAIIFSAGLLLENQVRNTSSDRKNAFNYLETANGRSNATNGGPFIQGPIRNNLGNIIVNDQILTIHGNEVIAAAEKRVAREALLLLKRYKATNGYYPYPALYSASGCVDTGSGAYFTDCQSDATTCRGRFPDNASEVTQSLPNWEVGKMPDWFSYNLWGQTIYYAVGHSSLNQPSPALIAKCSPAISIGTKTGVTGVLITAGTPKGTIVRSQHSNAMPNPKPPPLKLPLRPQSQNLSDYFESTENQDGWTGSTADVDAYVIPGSNSNDQIFILP